MPAPPLIDAMTVANVGFLIDNLGKDAGELQYLRELVQNAFEAVGKAKRGDAGRVEIDFEEVNGVRKLRVTDNGVGMTSDEVAENINKLSATTGVQAFDKNFGIGAKITAAVRNPYGVMYKAWKGGEGSITILGRAEGRYGRIGWRNSEDDRVDYWLPLSEDDKPSIIRDSGVAVVLLGKSEDDDTTVAPPGAELPSQWVAAYLERRYFRVPKGVMLRILRPVEIYDSGRGQYRAMYDTIRGQQYYLDKHSEHRGRIDLPELNAVTWWWLSGRTSQRAGRRGTTGAMSRRSIKTNSLRCAPVRVGPPPSRTSASTRGMPASSSTSSPPTCSAQIRPAQRSSSRVGRRSTTARSVQHLPR